MAKITGIRKRWMFNSIGAVLLILVLAVSAFSVAMGMYYYSSMSTGLASRAESTINYFSNYKSEADYLQVAYNHVETFSESSRLELQFLSPRGVVIYSSTRLTVPGSAPGTLDVEQVLTIPAGDEPSKTPRLWSGVYEPTGERIMSVSAPLIYNGSIVGILRFVTSTRLVDRQIALTIGLALLICAGILAIVYFSNMIFVRSIVDPVAKVTETAKRIAGGSYGIQMEKQFDDEIGDLTDAINDMSMKIKQSEKLQSEFISSVSHELRTPLTAINGWAETLMSGEIKDPEDTKKGMGIIVSEARRLTNMVEELLEFSRIADGRFTLYIEPIDLKAELEDAVYTYREFFRWEGIMLTHTDCEEEFPAVSGDSERLRQVFCNLLDNASKHGGVGKRVDTSICREENCAVIRIRDYGPGIPVEELPHVKYRFYKGSSKTRGSGIGLAVCEEIISRHNGSLTLSNAEGGGCQVTIRLPLET